MLTKFVSTMLLCVACVSCAHVDRLAAVGRAYWPRDVFVNSEEDSARQQRHLEEQRMALEERAAKKQITWVQAARELRTFDRRSNVHFDKVTADYHAYSLKMAEEVDAGRLTIRQYDALRVQRLVDIQKRRARQ